MLPHSSSALWYCPNRHTHWSRTILFHQLTAPLPPSSRFLLPQTLLSRACYLLFYIWRLNLETKFDIFLKLLFYFWCSKCSSVHPFLLLWQQSISHAEPVSVPVVWIAQHLPLCCDVFIVYELSISLLWIVHVTYLDWQCSWGISPSEYSQQLNSFDHPAQIVLLFSGIS